TLQETMAEVRSEVEIAARNLEAAYQTVVSRRESLRAVAAEAAYLEDRWRRLRSDANLGQLQLDDLLNAQNRLLEEEQTLVRAQAAIGVAIVELQRVTGVLVTTQRTNGPDAIAPSPDDS
ncbi:MAG: TolC family protein, partial [Planctomycetota bacterium]